MSSSESSEESSSDDGIYAFGGNIKYSQIKSLERYKSQQTTNPDENSALK